MPELARFERTQPAVDAGDGGSVLGKAGQGVVSRQASRDELANHRGEIVEALDSVGGQPEDDPGLGQRGRRAHLLGPALLALGQHAQRLVALRCGLLAIFGLGGNPWLLGKVELDHDRHLGRLEPVDHLGGFAAPHDHGAGAELVGQVEGAVDLVAGVRFPPDRDFLRARGR